jgi:hypothetical protein
VNSVRFPLSDLTTPILNTATPSKFQGSNKQKRTNAISANKKCARTSVNSQPSAPTTIATAATVGVGPVPDNPISMTPIRQFKHLGHLIRPRISLLKKPSRSRRRQIGRTLRFWDVSFLIFLILHVHLFSILLVGQRTSISIDVSKSHGLAQHNDITCTCSCQHRR